MPFARCHTEAIAISNPRDRTPVSLVGYVRTHYRKLPLPSKVFRKEERCRQGFFVNLSPNMPEFIRAAAGILTVLLLAVALSSTALTSVEAARRLPAVGQQQDAGHRMLHERARSLIMAWVAQLTQGPSPRGPGH